MGVQIGGAWGCKLGVHGGANWGCRGRPLCLPSLYACPPSLYARPSSTPALPLCPLCPPLLYARPLSTPAPPVPLPPQMGCSGVPRLSPPHKWGCMVFPTIGAGLPLVPLPPQMGCGVPPGSHLPTNGGAWLLTSPQMGAQIGAVGAGPCACPLSTPAPLSTLRPPVLYARPSSTPAPLVPLPPTYWWLGPPSLVQPEIAKQLLITTIARYKQLLPHSFPQIGGNGFIITE
jgi:hypothetical protein